MAIFDEKKMEQKPVYPTKRTPSYADWALFNMGKELEESIPSGVTVDQEVIAGSTNAVAGGAVKTYVDTEVAGVNGVPASTVEDADKILTVDENGEPSWSTPLTPHVTVDQTVIADSTNPVAGGGVKTYVDTEIAGVNEVPDSTVSDAGKILTVDSNGAAKWEDVENITEQTVVTGSVEPVSGGAVKNYVDTEIAGVNEVPASTTLDSGKILSVDSNGVATWDDTANIAEQSVIAGSVEPVSGGAVKNYVDTEIAGVNEVPASTVADVNKVLTVDSNGNANWQAPSSGGLTFHTFNSFSEMKSILLNQPVFYVITTSSLSLNFVITGNTIRIYYRSTLSGASSASIMYAYHDILDTDSTSITMNYDRIQISTNGTVSHSTDNITVNINTIYAIY